MPHIICWVILGLEDELGWRLVVELDVRVQLEWRLPEMTGIEDHRKIRPAAHGVDGINGLVDPSRPVRAHGDGKMTAGRETQNSNLVRVHAPLGGPGSHDAQCALRILERNGRA